jgi:hypothetical protein
MNEETMITRHVPLTHDELQCGKTYRIRGHWLGDFVGTLVEPSGWLYWRFKVITAESGTLQPGQVVEIGYHHARFYPA